MLGVIVFLLTTLISTLALWYLERAQHLSFMDSFWMTVVTMTTVGYGDIYPKTVAGRLFTICVPMLCGIGAMAYLISLLSSHIIRKGSGLMAITDESKIRFKDHILIINFPTEGKILSLLEALQSHPKFARRSFVLIADDIKSCPERLIKQKNFYFVKGHPSLLRVLEKANAAHASAAVLLAKNPKEVDSDGLTIQVALMLEQMHQKAGKTLPIVAEVISADSIDPLRAAGVETVVCLEKMVPPILAKALAEEIAGPLSSDME
jgi:voltage-gated potassium channel